MKVQMEGVWHVRGKKTCYALVSDVELKVGNVFFSLIKSPVFVWWE